MRPLRLLPVALACLSSFAAEVEVVPTPNLGIAPDAEVDEQGVIHLAYVAGEDVWYVKSADEGRTFSPPLRVNSEPKSAHAGKYRGPDLAVDKKGRIHIVWYGNGYQRHLPKDQWGVFYSHLDPGAAAFAATRNLNHKPSDNFSVAADQTGQVAVFWMAGGIFLNRSRDEGETFSEPERMALADPCECCGSRAWYGADGTLYCCYRDKAGDWRDMYVGVLLAGAPAFTREKLSGTPWHIQACPMSGDFLTGTKEGLIAAWETKGEVFAARLSSAGKLKGGEIRLGEGRYPVAQPLPDGGMVAAWKNGSELKWQRFNAAGQAEGAVQSATGANGDRPAGVVTRSGRVVFFN